eukprot:8608288-Pyramimonas_sp.AAC.1
MQIAGKLTSPGLAVGPAVGDLSRWIGPQAQSAAGPMLLGGGSIAAASYAQQLAANKGGSRCRGTC